MLDTAGRAAAPAARCKTCGGEVSWRSCAGWVARHSDCRRSDVLSLRVKDLLCRVGTSGVSGEIAMMTVIPCERRDDTGWVCEANDHRAWATASRRPCTCGAPGMPGPTCNTSDPPRPFPRAELFTRTARDT